MNVAMVTHTQALDLTSSQPARRSRRTEAGAAFSPRGRGCTRVSSAAPTTNVAASNANASAAPAPSTSAVARAGPTKKATFAIDSVSALASWISVSGTVCGIRPLYAGWKKA